ncbi:MAG: hypothetical protein IGQ45_07680 [Cyanobacterium sp. T60_A2020_053]|nr:hypothetical protein [Cyanobacterium sp. T60_A2020_053]
MFKRFTFNQFVKLIKNEINNLADQIMNNQTSNWLDNFILSNSEEEFFLQAIKDQKGNGKIDNG